MTGRLWSADQGPPPRLLVRTVAIDEPAPLAHLVPERDGLVWLRGGDGLIGSGVAVRLEVGRGPRRTAEADEHLRRLVSTADVRDHVGLPGTGPVAFGSLTFDPEAGGSVLVVPQLVIGRRDGTTWMTTIGEPSASRPTPPPPQPLRPTDRVRYAGASVPDHLWMAAVAQAVERIEAGQFEKVVLARDQVVWTREAFDPRVLVRRLATHFPGCFTFLCDRLVGATPELLVRRTGEQVTSVVLAGSTARGTDAAHDDELAALLLASDKDRREHELAVGSVREALGPLCEQLEVDERPRLLRLENVQHLATHLRGRLSATGGEATSGGLDRWRPSALALAGVLHPTGAVGGVPRSAALDAIRELEGMDRGRYAGPVGWVDARGDGEWGIALRCAEVEGARGRMFAGAGVVAGSLPEAELEETRLKLLAMRSAFEG